MDLIEYTGQCVGGPDNGNFISATIKEWSFESKMTWWLDGPDKKPNIVITNGKYIWDEKYNFFRWQFGSSRVEHIDGIKVN